MKPLALTDIHSLKTAIQYFQDCYLVSSVGALTNSTNGRRILTENILRTDDGFRIRFHNLNGVSKDFFVTQRESDNLVYMDKYMNPIPIDENSPHNPIIKAIEVSMNKLLKLYPSKKSLICRVAQCNEKFEFNKASVFMELFTGKKPISINEGGIRLNLKSKKQESLDLFEKISDDKNNSFVMGTAFGVFKKLNNTHYYSVKNMDKDSETIELFDHRRQKTINLTFEEAIKNIKSIAGYFNRDLMP